MLYAFRIRDRSVVAKFRSQPFEVEPGRTIRVPKSAIPSPKWYGDAPLADREGFLPAQKPVPAESAAQEASRYVINGIFEKPPDWEQRELMYLVAIPALDGSNEDVGAGPMLVVYGLVAPKR
jgi:hypothetical protein